MFVSEYANAAERWISPQIKSWSATWSQNLIRWLEPELARIDNAAWGAQIRDAVQLDIADPMMWANQRVDLPAHHWAIAGIRFRGQDIKKPFVDIIATSLAPDADGIAALGGVLSLFDVFKPLCFRVHMPDGSALRALLSEGHAVAEQDLLVVAGRVTDILARHNRDEFHSVELVRCSADEAAQRTDVLYDEARKVRTQLFDWATPSNAEALEAAEAQGLLFDVRVQGRSAGIVASERSDAYGFTGHVVEEIVIDAFHRGNGYGVAVMYRLAQEVERREGDVLWGHIHPDNVPSLRNAFASGREAISAHIWVTPSGYKGMPR